MQTSFGCQPARMLTIMRISSTTHILPRSLQNADISREEAPMAHKRIERKKELDRRRKRRKERLKERIKEAKAAAKK